MPNLNSKVAGSAEDNPSAVSTTGLAVSPLDHSVSSGASLEINGPQCFSYFVDSNGSVLGLDQAGVTKLLTYADGPRGKNGDDFAHKKKATVKLEEKKEILLGLSTAAKNIFSRFPDDWMTDIFSQVTFVVQCQLSRTCRRWNALLHSPTVLPNILFDLGSDMIIPTRRDCDHPFLLLYKEIRHNAKYINTILIRGGFGGSIRVNCIRVCATALIALEESEAVCRKSRRHLVIYQSYYLMLFIPQEFPDVFYSMEFRQVLVQDRCLKSFLPLSNGELESSTGAFEAVDVTGLVLFLDEVDGHSRYPELNPTLEDCVLGKMTPLTDFQLDELVAGLAEYDDEKVQNYLADLRGGFKWTPDKLKRQDIAALSGGRQRVILNWYRTQQRLEQTTQDLFSQLPFF